MHGKNSQGRPIRPHKPFGRRPAGGGKPKPRPATNKGRGPVGDPRLVYRRDPAAFGLRRAESLAVGGEVQACEIKESCGACKFVNLDYKSSLSAKYQEGLDLLRQAGVLSIAHIIDAVESPRALGYRAYFKLAVRPYKADPKGESALSQPKKENLRAAESSSESEYSQAYAPEKRFTIGLFEPGTHHVVDMQHCPLHVPALRKLLVDLKSELDLSSITPYDEELKTGQLRYIAARSAHLTGEIMLTFVVTTSIRHELRSVVQRLIRRGHKINSAHMNLNSHSGNAIFGQETIRLAGSDRLRERLCELDFEIGPTSFFQVNPWQAINLYRRVEAIAGQAQSADAPVAWDLYCGTGQISLVLARLGYRVLGIEENSLAVTDAKTNTRKNHLDQRAEFIASRVEDSDPLIPIWAKSPSLIVVNPSRRGLHESTRVHLTKTLKQRPQARFVYVSCNVETLARDLKELTQSGFSVRQIEAFDMFAQTDNLEWLVVLTR